MTTRGAAITLHALHGAPLEQESIERIVRATAHAIAERVGIGVIVIETSGDRITVRLDCPHVAALGFAAELRRITNRWYADKHGGDSLWGDAGPPGSP